MDYVITIARPSLSIFVCSKQSKTGGIEGLGMRLVCLTFEIKHLYLFSENS